MALPPPLRKVPDDPLAACHAARACTEAVHLAFTAGGSDALFDDHPLQRFQRDILVGQQHTLVAFHSYEGLGRDLLAGDREDLPGPA